jgi:prevent-host-death family protein
VAETFIPIEDAGTRLRDLVERARAGEAIVVTLNGRPAARLTALRARGETVAADLRDAVAGVRAVAREIADDWHRRGITGPTWEELKAEAEAELDERLR